MTVGRLLVTQHIVTLCSVIVGRQDVINVHRLENTLSLLLTGQNIIGRKRENCLPV